MLFIKLLHRTIAQIIVASPKWKFNASFVVHSLSRAGRWNLQFIFSRTESQVFSLQVYASFMNTGRDMTGGETPSSDPTSGAKTPLSRELNTQLSFQKEQSTWKTTHGTFTRMPPALQTKSEETFCIHACTILYFLTNLNLNYKNQEGLSPHLKQELNQINMHFIYEI